MSDSGAKRRSQSGTSSSSFAKTVRLPATILPISRKHRSKKSPKGIFCPLLARLFRADCGVFSDENGSFGKHVDTRSKREVYCPVLAAKTRVCEDYCGSFDDYQVFYHHRSKQVAATFRCLVLGSKGEGSKKLISAAGEEDEDTIF